MRQPSAVLVLAVALPPVVLGLHAPATQCSGHGAVGTTSNGSLACFCFPLWRGTYCETPTCGPCVYGDCVESPTGARGSLRPQGSGLWGGVSTVQW